MLGMKCMSSMNACHQIETFAKELACDHYLSYAEHNTFGYRNKWGMKKVYVV